MTATTHFGRFQQCMLKVWNSLKNIRTAMLNHQMFEICRPVSLKRFFKVFKICKWQKYRLCSHINNSQPVLVVLVFINKYFIRDRKRHMKVINGPNLYV
jgi:poly(3-hydroxyalkanoate) synthetase